MVNKRLLVIILSVLFVFTAVAVGFFALTDNTIEVSILAFEDSDEQLDRLNGELSVFKGKNFLFVDPLEIEQIVEADPYFECLSVKKQFPDKIFVNVRERREVYYITVNEKNYLLDEKGFVLSEFNGEISRNFIKINLSNVTIENLEIGNVIKTSSPILDTIFYMVEKVDSTDCIKEMTIEDKVVQTDVVFDTYTSVKIRIVDAGTSGLVKAEKAFSVYHDEAQDYVKTFNELKAYLENGVPVALWTRHP